MSSKVDRASVESPQLDLVSGEAAGVSSSDTETADRVHEPEAQSDASTENDADSESTAYSHLVSAWLNEGCPLTPAGGNRSFGYQLAKRAADVAGALVLLVLFAPIMIVTTLVLLVTTKGRPFFVQERVGERGRRFPMIKFRTMCLNADQIKHTIANEQDGPVFKNRRDPRITRIGAFLRSSSIDETPQVFNVLAGHMSLVGPRPPVVAEVLKYEPWQRLRLSVKPGLTCLWQVSGRCEIGFQDWVRMDVRYLRNQNLVSDVTLLAKTPGSVISRRGAY